MDNPAERAPGAPQRAFVALGANMGDARATLLAAFDGLHALPRTRLTARSRLYRSAPIEASGPDFVNAAAELVTLLSPATLLAALNELEHAHGRERGARNAPRTLDLDLLLYGNRVIDTPTLQVPHPRMAGRAFVVRPLREIAPDLVLPDGRRVADLAGATAGQVVAPLAPESAP